MRVVCTLRVLVVASVDYSLSTLAVIKSRANLLEPDVQAAEKIVLAAAAVPFHGSALGVSGACPRRS